MSEPPASDAGEPDTPCVGVCSTGFDDVCRGCLRTAVEVGRWVEMSPEEKRTVWRRILAAGYVPRRQE
ncbi:DUF1289 domain-containing protein [Thiomonas intermedia]|uniref:DUF1289 domain-containing protein n=1 Tax=Thiomonas intermedia TaxID=926 RepID=UPI0009A4ECD5|nr:DUF1289 domain-containing protein [Thiomonas intermedia]